MCIRDSSWTAPIVLSSALSSEHGMTICGGLNGKGVVLSTGPGLGVISGFLKVFNPRTGTIRELSYPLNGVKSLTDYTMSCSLKSESEATVAISVVDNKEKEVVLAFGSVRIPSGYQSFIYFHFFTIQKKKKKKKKKKKTPYFQKKQKKPTNTIMRKQ
eukprot:TRINITY_DN49810_c0_g1_i1.p2 TRINITY_DN49810_c0_g1~~TRINITY_DN49810_c0_g1_i1.p2  ORF type:complete len:158 (+),score=22.37 TRINITY_DN49810_c0_g1_i1:177-650(+)